MTIQAKRGAILSFFFLPLRWCPHSALQKCLWPCSVSDTHTHNRLDQRFSVIGSLLARVQCLQTPEEYVSHLQEHYRSARGVPVLIEQVGDSYLWRNFFAPLDRHFAGVTGTRSTADAAHVFRVVRRDMVRLCAPEATFLEDDGLESDPVLLAKHWICSKGLSQPPTVLLQGAFPLDFRNLLPLRAPRTALSFWHLHGSSSLQLLTS